MGRHLLLELLGLGFTVIGFGSSGLQTPSCFGPRYLAYKLMLCRCFSVGLRVEWFKYRGYRSGC